MKDEDDNKEDTGSKKEQIESTTEKLETEYLYPINNQKKAAASASNFQKDIKYILRISGELKKKDNILRRAGEIEALRTKDDNISTFFIIPVLTHLEILTERQFRLFGYCMDCNAEQPDDKDRAKIILDNLLHKGYFNGYTYENDGMKDIAYMFSVYGKACWQKETVRTNFRKWAKISMLNNPLAGSEKVEKNIILDRVEYNDVLLKYFYDVKNILPEHDYDEIKKSIKWHGDHYQVAVLEDNEPKITYLYKDGANIDNAKEDGVLIVKELVKTDLAEIIKCEKPVYVFDNGRLSKYDTDGSVEEISFIKENEKLEENITDENQEEIVISDTKDTDNVSDNIDNVSVDDKAEEINNSAVSEEENENLSAEADEGYSDDNLSDLSIEEITNLKDVPDEEDFCKTITDILQSKTENKDELRDAIVNSVLLAQGAALIEDYDRVKALSMQLQLASDTILDDCKYSSTDLMQAFSDEEKVDPCMLLAAYIFAMLKPQHMYDYDLYNEAKGLVNSYDEYFKGLEAFKILLEKVISIKDLTKYGFSPSIIASFDSNRDYDSFEKDLIKRAESYLEIPSPKAEMKPLKFLYNDLFGLNSDLYTSMSIISQNDKDIDHLRLNLEDYCDKEQGKYKLNENKIEEMLNKAWPEAWAKAWPNRMSRKLVGKGKANVVQHIKKRLEVIKDRVEYHDSLKNKDNDQDISTLKNIRRDIFSLIDGIRKNSDWQALPSANILAWMLNSIEDYLKDDDNPLNKFSSLLYTGEISLSDEGNPILDDSLAKIKYYEPWRNALKHIISLKNHKTWDKIGSEISSINNNNDLSMFDNLQQMKVIGFYLNDMTEKWMIDSSQVNDARRYAKDKKKSFYESLELAYTYGRITENEKEVKEAILETYQDKFFNIKDFARWRRFLNALSLQIKDSADEKKSELNIQIGAGLRSNPNADILKKAQRLVNEDQNFSVAEEYINRFKNGETELFDKINLVLNDKNHFEEFLSEEIYNKIYDHCERHKGEPIKKFAWHYIEKMCPKEWTTRQKESSQRLLDSWPVRKGNTNPGQIERLFKELGFTINSAAKETITGNTVGEVFSIKINRAAKGMPDYAHPIASFGTQMQSALKVLILYGNNRPNELIDTVNRYDLGRNIIVLMDHAITAADRREICEVFHMTSEQNTFLLIDRILIMYLALQEQTERLPIMLKCTLPYTSYQPFSREAGAIADEMFFGRVQEVNTLIDPNGACVVYGGRQLGKTALLQRVESRCHKPDEDRYAYYISILNCKTESDVVNKIREKIIGINVLLDGCVTLSDISGKLNKAFKNGKIESFYLLLDEADNFLKSIANDNYKQIEPLVELRRDTHNSFKFIIAGLHNVCRARNATSRNGIFGQLGSPLCIKPLSPVDALALISKPLRYLGFKIDQYPHLETILTNTNYYPGILQFFGYRLVETLTGHDYNRYYRAAHGNPPFELKEEQLGAVMNDADLNKSIRDKFRLSLELDSRYFMLARCVALLYFLEEDKKYQGYSVIEIKEIAEVYEASCLADETEKSYGILLDEMVEMGILTNLNDDKYRLRKNSFLDIIGKDPDAIADDIKKDESDE